MVRGARAAHGEVANPQRDTIPPVPGWHALRLASPEPMADAGYAKLIPPSISTVCPVM